MSTAFLSGPEHGIAKHLMYQHLKKSTLLRELTFELLLRVRKLHVVFIILLYIQWIIRIKDMHVGDNIISAVVSFVERLSSFGGSKCIRTIGKQIFGTLNCVLCREVYYTVSLSRRVHYQRFHCMYIESVNVQLHVWYMYIHNLKDHLKQSLIVWFVLHY